MPLRKRMRGHSVETTMVDGILNHDYAALSEYQLECMQRLIFTIQLEQESYVLRHPEIKAMLRIFMARVVQQPNKMEVLKESIKYFVKSAEEIDKEIRKELHLSPGVPYNLNNPKVWYYEDVNLLADLENIRKKYYPDAPLTMRTPEMLTPNTVSSSFISINTSASTLPTPEPIPTPPLTIYEIFFKMVSNTVDKASTRYTDAELMYDTAYVELMHVVEEAMEIPVIAIREDIANLLGFSYWLFVQAIDEKDRIAAAEAWERRMRKKLKRTLRRQKNFKGYETPPTPKSVISSHESYKIPPVRPCVCHPQFTYNRYPKDRFGIYLPQDTGFSTENLTVVDFNLDKAETQEDDTNDATSAKSYGTTKTDVTTKSGATTKSTATTKSNATTKSGATARFT